MYERRKYLKKRNYKKQVSLLCGFFVVMTMIVGNSLSIKADDTLVTHSVYHKHIAGCQGTVYEEIEADIYRNLTISGRDTCSICGGIHDHYSFTAKCSCGRTWSTTGHACINSPEGTNRGNCSNYSYINCVTKHSHPKNEYVCGLTEESVIETIIIKSNTMLPAQEVILSAESSGNLEEVEFVWNENESGSMMTVYENGSYDLYAKYNEGNVEYIEQIEVVVNNVDRDLPVVSEIQIDKSEYTNQNIILSIEASDAGGLPENYISWNGEDFGNENSYEISENGSYDVIIKDIAGNTVIKTIEIEHIDKAAPEIKEVNVLPEPWYSGTCRITVVAEDIGSGNAGSGLAEQPYSFDGGETWVESNQYELSEPGIVIIQVRDAVGNITEREMEAVRQNRPVVENNNTDNTVFQSPTSENEVQEISPMVPSNPDAKGNHDKTDSETKEEPLESDGKEEKDSTLKYMFLPKPNWKAEVVEIQIEEEPLYAEIETDEVEILESAENEINWLRVSCISVIGVTFFSALIFFVYVLFGMCRIYEVDNCQREKHLGRTGIRLQKNGYCIKIGETIIHRASSRILKATLPKWFIKFAEYKPFKIIIRENVIDKYVERNVDFQINS